MHRKTQSKRSLDIQYISDYTTPCDSWLTFKMQRKHQYSNGQLDISGFDHFTDSWHTFIDKHAYAMPMTQIRKH